MAAINGLIEQISDKKLRARLEAEAARLMHDKKFGLVFEEHIPECTPLWDTPIRKGTSVARKTGRINTIYIVASVNDESVLCYNRESDIQEEIPINELVAVARFGEPIFPSLESMAIIENAKNSSLWHTLIEADNYHALQLLEYLYPRQVDCIYIDPPYNTGARDWKYNNDYVDSSDGWRHSKWLSMMQKRLRIATRLLAPSGVIAISIDHNELAHLVCLLESSGLFGGHEMTIITVVHNPRGNITNNFARTNEYVLYLTPKSSKTLARTSSENEKPRKLRRWGHFSLRTERPTMFYPIYVKNGMVSRIGAQPDDAFHPNGRNVPIENGEVEIWPIDQDGVERRWNFSHSEIGSHLERIVALPKDDGLDLFIISESSPPKTVWADPELDAGGVYGSGLVDKLATSKFPFPKSLYTVFRCIEPAVLRNPNALIIDFFAGSGTTLNAVNLLNAVDNGNRRCILITNNEVSEAEARMLARKGYQPDDAQWEKQGICRLITWPRTENSILGRRHDGAELDGEYITGVIMPKEISRSFYQLGFSDGLMMLSDIAKKQLVAVLRNKDGKAQLPQSLVEKGCPFIVSEKHSATIIFDVAAAEEWIKRLDGEEHISDFYIVTSDKVMFNSLKSRIMDLLGPIIGTAPLKRPMSEGFATNVEYFKLSFLDRARVSLGRQFREILPLLWLKAGARGKRPVIDNGDLPEMLICPENGFAVLLDEMVYAEFTAQIAETVDIETIYFVTNSEDTFREMAEGVDATYSYQLYRDYIDNFVLGSRRRQR
jgi:adenine-specific DNA-methyltransferase